MSNASATLVYWGIHARGTPAAAVAALGHVDLTWDSDTANAWPASKAEAPFGQLPLLKVGGATVGQSGAIVHVLGRLGNVQGADARSYGISEMITAEAWDLFEGLAKSKYSADSAAAYTKYFQETLPAQYAYLERLLGDQHFFAGEHALQGDATLWGVLYIIERANAGLAATALATAPKLAAWKARFEALEQIKPLHASFAGKGAYFEFNN